MENNGVVNFQTSCENLSFRIKLSLHQTHPKSKQLEVGERKTLAALKVAQTYLHECWLCF